MDSIIMLDNEASYVKALRENDEPIQKARALHEKQECGHYIQMR